MKIRILSDLHLELTDWEPPAVSADVVVLAGDIDVGVRGLSWASRHFPDTPVIYVPGNHEYYHGRMQDVLASLREEARRAGIHLLDQDEETIEGVRFRGATLKEPGMVKTPRAAEPLRSVRERWSKVRPCASSGSRASRGL